VVENIERFKANLEFALAVLVEAPEDAGVEIGNTWAAELIAVRVAEWGGTMVEGS
jgi:hypothetical protein